MKPKVNIKDAAKKYTHAAPEIHRGDSQSTASDVYSFGVLAVKVLQDGKFVNPALKTGAPNGSFLSDPLKRNFWLSGVPLKLCRFISGHPIIFLSL